MFSRLLHTAKSYISPTPPPTESAPVASTSLEQPTPEIPSVCTENLETTGTKQEPLNSEAIKQEENSQEISNPTPTHTTRIHSPDMVTTRQDAHYKEEQGGELTEENSVNVYVPESSSANGKGKKRSVVAEDGEGTLSRSAKKRKVAALSVREKEGDAIAKADGEGIVVRNTRLVVEIPVTKAMREIADKIEAEKKADSAKEGKKHKKFGSDDEGGEEEILSTARKAPVIKEMVEEESSDDEAPEEVGAQSAAEEVKIQEQSAQQAIQSLRKKRKERASKTQNKPKKLLNGENINTTDPLEALSDALDEAELQDSSSESDSESENEPMSRSNRTKFELTLDRAPKDRKVGTTTYRVTKVQTKNLAPKSGKRAKDTKEAWLQGRNGKKGLGALRKPVKKGFFN